MARTRSWKVSIDGIPELEAALEDASSETRKAVERSIGEEADELADDMRRNVPVDTGDLKDSIISRHEGLDGQAAATAAHAEYVEFGTSTHREQPFALPAAEKGRKRLPDRVSDAVKAAVT